MRFDVLGPVEMRRADGAAVPVGGPRVRGLLALLLLGAGQVVRTERLIDGLYGDRPPRHATRALQSQVWRLRHALDGDAELEFHQSGYRLAVEPESVDAHRFEQLAAAGRRALDSGESARATEALDEALSLWHGAALSGVTDTPFLAAQAARLEELRFTALEDRADAELLAGRCHGLVAELRERICAGPLRERPRGQLMRALHASGRTAEALALYEETRRVLAAELGTEPGAELRAVHLAVLRDEPADTPPPVAPRAHGTPPPRSRPDPVPAAPGAPSAGARRPPAPTAPTAPTAPGPARRHRLPAPLTSFVGRDEPVRRLGDLLDEVRLVTLTGPGGSGKTRLAIETATRRDEDVYLVELAGQAPATDVPRAVLDALGIHDAPVLPVAPAGRRRAGSPVTERLVSALADRRSLLVLDNCEHVVEDVSRLAQELLDGCPGLTVLVTSREALGITGETLLAVTPLEVPPDDRGTDPERALRYAAVRLFSDRARAVRSGFALDADTVRPVLKICRALDGLPLAIELAAARLRSLPLGELAARLDDRFALLSRGSRTAPPRHRTLSAVVDWSWDLLDEEERILARRLSVFPAGATQAAAERVCGPFSGSTLDLLSSLSDKSFVTATGEAEPRYRMLETVRAYCARRLAEAGETEWIRRAHAAHVTEFAEAAAPHLRDAAQLDWLSRLTAVHDDIVAALHWSTRADPARALRLAAALWSYWWLRGPAGEGAERMRDVLVSAGTTPPPDLAAQYVICVAGTVLSMRPTPDLHSHLRAAVALGDGLDPDGAHPLVALIRPVVALATGDHDAELPPFPHTGRAEPNAPDGDPALRAAMHQLLGMLHQGRGRPDRAERWFTVALDGFRASGDRLGAIQVLPELARIAGWNGHHERAVAFVDEALALAVQLGSTTNEAYLLGRRAAERRSVGDLAGAETDSAAAGRLARAADAPELVAAAQHHAGETARLRGDHASARRALESALRGCGGTWLGEEIRVRTLTALGRVSQAEGDQGGARERHGRALDVVLVGWDLATIADTADGLAGVLVADSPVTAATVLGASTALRGVRATDQDTVLAVRDARRHLGARAFRQAYGAGSALSRQEGLALLARALSEIRE